jgi:hypothetical protein
MTDRSIYQTKLGTKFNQLPTILQNFHSLDGPKHWRGQASISGGQGIIARSVRWLFGFPAPTDEVQVDVKVVNGAKSGVSFERWQRVFGNKSFHSVLSHEKNDGFIERFGILGFKIGLDVHDQGIIMPVIGWKIGPIPLPLCLAPKSETLEFQDNQGRFRFDVKVSLPIIGLLMHYQGWLEPEAE